MGKNKPLLIIISCTRNYAWVTRAFLEGNTYWADYIIMVDQMSTDGSREMFAEYNLLKGDGIHKAEIVLIDDADMAYKENTRARIAFMKGRELAAGREVIYFSLADKGIGTVIHYPIAPHHQECYAKEAWNVPQLSLPITEEIADTELSLPISPCMTKEQMEYVVKCINAFR